MKRLASFGLMMVAALLIATRDAHAYLDPGTGSMLLQGLIACSAEPASFRDPSGHVFVQGERVFRTVMRCAAADYEFVRDQGLLERLAEEGRLVASAEVDPGLLGAAEDVRY